METVYNLFTYLIEIKHLASPVSKKILNTEKNFQSLLKMKLKKTLVNFIIVLFLSTISCLVFFFHKFKKTFFGNFHVPMPDLNPCNIYYKVWRFLFFYNGIHCEGSSTKYSSYIDHFIHLYIFPKANKYKKNLKGNSRK